MESGPGGIRTGWDQVLVGKNVRRSVLLCLLAFSFGDFFQKAIIDKVENSNRPQTRLRRVLFFSLFRTADRDVPLADTLVNDTFPHLVVGKSTA